TNVQYEPYAALDNLPQVYRQHRTISMNRLSVQFRSAAAAGLLPFMATAAPLADSVTPESSTVRVPPPATAIDVAAIDRARVLKAAQAALTIEPITITKFRAPLSEGGPNDFYSNGDYWWPDPKKTNGLPYIRRDGQSNPDNFTKHRHCVMQMRDAVAALGAAYRITHDDRYAAKASELLRVFFLDPKTRMNPNLQYAQAIPGVSPGRGTGIIDTLQLTDVPLAIMSMEPSPAFSRETFAGTKKWFQDYIEWRRASKNGQEEAEATNTHAVAYWVQIAVFARFTGDQVRSTESRRRFKEVFVPKQMAADGSFPAEL